MKEIENYIQTYFGVGHAELPRIGDLFHKVSVKKNEFLLKKNSHSQNISFIRSGYFRIFAIDEMGEKEVTQWISGEGSFITDLSSFTFGNPARWNIQALTNCELYSISRKDFDNIGTIISNWEHLEKLFIAKCFITLENRVFSQLSMSAEQKVRGLMKSDPQIFLHVPHLYIASMLGMSAETLSRVRSKMIS